VTESCRIRAALRSPACSTPPTLAGAASAEGHYLALDHVDTLEIYCYYRYTKNVTITKDQIAPDTVFDTRTKTQPIEVWLSQPRFEVSCRIAYEDERTDSMDIVSLSMRGAQREVTGFLIGHGYEPAGRWVIEGEREEVPVETSRRFKPANPAANLLEVDQGTDSSRGSPATAVETREFYVYENWTNTFACVHLATCSFCQHGQGVQRRGSSTPNGKWHGSFPTFDEALNAARTTARGHANSEVWAVKPCGICLRAESRCLR
jgi:hypothetical protein